jgi:hypothetical protein
VDNTIEKPKKNLGESIRQRLKNLSQQRNRPFDEILRYYAMERFLFRLSISSHAKKFVLKGGLMLKVDQTYSLLIPSSPLLWPNHFLLLYLEAPCHPQQGQSLCCFL